MLKYDDHCHNIQPFEKIQGIPGVQANSSTFPGAFLIKIKFQYIPGIPGGVRTLLEPAQLFTSADHH